MAKLTEAKNKQAYPAIKAMDLVRQIAMMQPIKYGDGSWTDQQAEDAIVTVNQLIRLARKIA